MMTRVEHHRIAKFLVNSHVLGMFSRQVILVARACEN